ncbi:hypothetical protein Droror1_Dr00023280 [Drosera rotundifolia]
MTKQTHPGPFTNKHPQKPQSNTNRSLISDTSIVVTRTRVERVLKIGEGSRERGRPPLSRGKGPRFGTDPTTADAAGPIPPGLSEAEWEVVRMMRACRDEPPRGDFIGETEELSSEEAESSEPEEVEVHPPPPVEPIPIPRRDRYAPVRPLTDYDVAEHHGLCTDHFVRAAPTKFS